MRLILLVSLFLIWETWSPDEAAMTLVPSLAGFSILMSGYCLLIMGMRWWGGRLADGLVRGDPRVSIDRFNLGTNISRFLIPIWFGVGVFLLGWHHTVDLLLMPVSRLPVMTPCAIVGLMPGFFGWMGLWWSQYPVDAALREHNALNLFEADLPVFAPAEFRSYFVNKLRVQLLFTTVPVVLILGLRDMVMLGVMYLSTTETGRSMGVRLPLSDTTESILTFGPAIVVLVFSPAILRHVLQTERLPESRLRRSLATLAEKTGVRCREILLWRTQHNMGNAAVMGMIPRVRFVMLSDLLLESMTDLQIQAVFAHELGHVKHRHLLWFVAFFLTALGCLTGVSGIIESALHLHGSWREAYDVLSVLGSAAVMFTAFGFMSRWFERQADVFAARAIQRWADLTVDMPDVPSPVPMNLGSDVFASALHRVAVVNNIPIEARNFTHGSIDSRIRFIRRFGRDTEVAARFDRTSSRVFVALIAVIGICAIAAVAGLRAGIH